MDASDYQRDTANTAIYDESVADALGSSFDSTKRSYLRMMYCATGIAGEAGEIAEHMKKMLRDDKMMPTVERREALFKEVGDLMWYVSQFCTEMNFSMSEVMEHNLVKLQSRKERGVLHGDGDNR
jgi:NTP pyrophosphatase (non-canonical NTP hydrolase)